MATPLLPGPTNCRHANKDIYVLFAEYSRRIAPIMYIQTIQNHTRNVIFSPFSVFTVFLLSKLGLTDAAAEEIRRTVNGPSLDYPTLRSAMAHFYADCRHANEDMPYTVQSKSKLFASRDSRIPLRAEGAGPQQFEAEDMPFADRNVAAFCMNRWLAAQTCGDFPALVKSADLAGDVYAVLLNAVRFHADFSQPTALRELPERFYVADGPAARVPQAMVCAYLKYAESEELRAQLVELPFWGEEAALVVALPNERDGLAALEGRINRLFEIGCSGTAYVAVTLPTFKVETVVDVKAILQQAGIIGGGAGVRREREPLWALDKILQASCLQLSEKKVTNSQVVPPVALVHGFNVFGGNFPPKKVIADHPFIFYVKVHGAVVFAGRIVDPRII